LGVDNPAVIEAQEEFAGAILDMDKVVDQPIDETTHVIALNQVLLLPQQRMHAAVLPKIFGTLFRILGNHTPCGFSTVFFCAFFR
ncbi:hypothetical protein, partial [Neorhizobium tomejilense]